MARVSKTSPFPARRATESRSNNEGQEQRQETQTGPRSNNEGQENREESEDTQIELIYEDDEESSISSEDDWQEEEKKLKRKALMKKAGKRGRGRGSGPIKGVVIGLKAPETATSPKIEIGRARKLTVRKATFAVKSALYDNLNVSDQGVVTNIDPKAKGKEKVQETSEEFEEDEACKRITNYKRYMDDDRDKDYDGAHLHARVNTDVKI